MSIYPSNWPTCPNCGEPALDGHITCGSVRCNESDARRRRDRAIQVGREAGKAIERAYPFGYRSEDSEP